MHPVCAVAVLLAVWCMRESCAAYCVAYTSLPVDAKNCSILSSKPVSPARAAYQFFATVRPRMQQLLQVLKFIDLQNLRARRRESRAYRLLQKAA